MQELGTKDGSFVVKKENLCSVEAVKTEKHGGKFWATLSEGIAEVSEHHADQASV